MYVPNHFTIDLFRVPDDVLKQLADFLEVDEEELPTEVEITIDDYETFPPDRISGDMTGGMSINKYKINGKPDDRDLLYDQIQKWAQDYFENYDPY